VAEPADKDKPADKDAEKAVERAKKVRMLGNIRFIGELFLKGMIPEKIMHECVLHLLHNVVEEDIESACDLLRNIGKKLDNAKARKRVDQYFQRLKGLTQLSTLSSRLKFLCMDVADLRRNRWVPRIKKDKATKLDKVHEGDKKGKYNSAMKGGGSNYGKPRDFDRNRGGSQDVRGSSSGGRSSRSSGDRYALNSPSVTCPPDP